MKIAYISNSRFPSERAHAVQMVHMCNAFAQNGHDVTFVVTNRKTHITESPEAFYGTQFGFKVEYLSIADITGIILKIPNFLRPIFYTFQRCLYTIRLLRYLRTEHFEYIYGRDQWLLAVLSIVSSLPVVWESHEAKFSLVARFVVHRAKKIIVISEGIYNFYLKRGVMAERMLVAHDGIDDGFFMSALSKEEARTQLGIHSVSKPIVMYIGGLDVWKGVDTLFEAGTLGEDRFAVYVIGGGERELRDYTTRFPRVQFLGQRPYKNLKDFQQAADVLVIPNTAKNKLSAEYTSPLKLFAHMTSRVPIVASDIPSITNVLSTKEAYFFEADNAQSLLDTLDTVFKNTEQSREKAENAYTLSKHYTWTARAKSIVDFITV
jgi:glycosyltransferase involved in cell wall biosynthesis